MMQQIIVNAYQPVSWQIKQNKDKLMHNAYAQVPL